MSGTLFPSFDARARPIKRRVTHTAIASLPIEFRPALLAGLARVLVHPAVLHDLRKSNASEGPTKLRQILPGSEFRTAAGPTAKPSILRISPADILSIDGHIRKTIHILIPRWRLTPLDRGSVDDGILTCHWHHARFDLESGCTFDLWADDASICPVEVRNGEVWVKMTFGHANSAGHWRERLGSGLAHDINLVIAKAVLGQLVGDVPQADIVQQVALFGAKNRDGWGVGLTILTALANLLPVLPEEEAYLALFHGARWVAADCDGEAPRRERTPLDSQLEPTVLKRWLRRWTSVRHREAAERTLLTAIAEGEKPSMLADALLAAATQRAFADDGHTLDFINKAFECLDLIGWEHSVALLPTVVGQMVAARGAEEIDLVAATRRPRSKV